MHANSGKIQLFYYENSHGLNCRLVRKCLANVLDKFSQVLIWNWTRNYPFSSSACCLLLNLNFEAWFHSAYQNVNQEFEAGAFLVFNRELLKDTCMIYLLYITQVSLSNGRAPKSVYHMRPVHLKSVHFGEKKLSTLPYFKAAVETPIHKLSCTHL